MWIVTIEVPIWLCLVVGGVVSLAGVVCQLRWRAELERRLQAEAEYQVAEAQRLCAWHGRVWALWQVRVCEHATHYDEYWRQICIALLRVIVDRAGEARLHSMIRGAMASGTSPKSIAHALAMHHADDREFVRRFHGFAARDGKRKSQ